MPIIKSAVKKMKQDQRRYAQNVRTKRAIRTAVKKNVLSKAAAARRLSHLAKFAKENGVKPVASKKKATPAAKASVKAAAPKAAAAKKPAAKTAAKPAAKKAPAEKPAAAKASK